MVTFDEFFNVEYFEAVPLSPDYYVVPDEQFEVDFYIYDVVTLNTANLVSATAIINPGRNEVESSATITAYRMPGTYLWSFTGTIPTADWNGEDAVKLRLVIDEKRTFDVSITEG